MAVNQLGPSVIDNSKPFKGTEHFLKLFAKYRVYQVHQAAN